MRLRPAHGMKLQIIKINFYWRKWAAFWACCRQNRNKKNHTYEKKELYFDYFAFNVYGRIHTNRICGMLKPTIGFVKWLLIVGHQ